MSRCFPYPPPGYLLPSRGNDKGPLIDSIKLQKDKGKAREERRKERKKDRKRKREAHPIDEFGQGKPNNEKSQKLEKQTLSVKGKYTKSCGDDVSSDVTEEHEKPDCVAKPSYSSENSQISEKRKRQELQANTIKADGSILKIRLSSLKKEEPNDIDRDDERPSTSGRTDPIDQNDFEFGQRLIKEQHFSTTVRSGICVPGLIPVEKQPSLRFIDAQTSRLDATVSKCSISKASKAELLYKSLLENWPPMTRGSGGCSDDEQDWLFPRKSRNIGRSETSSNALCSLDSNLWPHAQLLPSVDAYALPYTVPF